MSYSRTIQTYTTELGKPWTVASLGSLPLGSPMRRVYAWVGMDEGYTYRLKTDLTVNLKNGGVIVETYDLTLVNKTTAVSGTTFADSFHAHDARNSATYPTMAPSENGLDFRFFARTGASGSDNLSFVHIRPVTLYTACDAAEIIVRTMSWESTGTLAAASPLVCYLGVLSTLK